MRSWVVSVRLVRQLVRDRRTLAMLFLAPVVILLLMSVVFSNSQTTIRVAAVNLPAAEIRVLRAVPNVDVEVISKASADERLSTNQVDAVLERSAQDAPGKVSLAGQGQAQTGVAVVLTVEGSRPSVTAQTLARIKVFQAQLAKEQGAVNAARQNGMEVPGLSVQVRYLHGGADLTTLDYFAPVLIGFFIFLFVFILSGVSFLRERTTGTLERALATPLRRGEMVLGYLVGFGGFAVMQTLVIEMIAIYGLRVTHAGSLWLVTLLNLLLAVVALSLGMLLSAFARTELQMLQFIPLVIVPQVFLSGIFDLRGMPQWVQLLSKVFPLTYGATALRDVMIRGAGMAGVWQNALALAGYAACFLLITGLALKKQASH